MSSLSRAGHFLSEVTTSRSRKQGAGSVGVGVGGHDLERRLVVNHGSGREVDDHGPIGSALLQPRQPIAHDIAGQFLAGLQGDRSSGRREQLGLMDGLPVGLGPRQRREPEASDTR